jgi:hypothetical protein
MAADLTQSFWGKHFEKIVVAAAGVIFIAAVIFFVVYRTPQADVRTSVEKMVEDLQKAKKPPSLKEVLGDEAEKLGIDQAPLTTKKYDEELNGLAKPPWNPSFDFVAQWMQTQTGTTTIAVARAPKIVPVTDVVTFWGRGTTAEKVENPIFKLDKPALSDIVWAGVLGHVDLTAQQEEYLNADDPVNPVFLTKIELQRREMKLDGTWTDWKSVTPSLTTTAAAKWPKMPANPRDIRLVQQWVGAVRTMQASIRHMPFYTLLGMDKEGKLAASVTTPSTGLEQPEAPKKAESVAAPVTPATAGQPAAAASEPDVSILSMPVVGGGPAIPPPSHEAAAPKRIVAPIWAYDASVEPGKTYQYQMRVAIINPIYGMKSADPKVRLELEFVGPWSDPSPQVAIPPLVNFYYVGTSGAKANVELQRWILSQWVRVSSCPTSLGAPVTYVKPQKLELPGSPGKMTTDNIRVDLTPGIIVVDMLSRFPYQPEGNSRSIPANIMIYVDSAGRLGDRIDWEDKKEAANAWAVREAGGSPTTTPTPTPVPVKPVPVKPVPPKIITPTPKGT